MYTYVKSRYWTHKILKNRDYNYKLIAANENSKYWK